MRGVQFFCCKMLQNVPAAKSAAQTVFLLINEKRFCYSYIGGFWAAMPACVCVCVCVCVRVFACMHACAWACFCVCVSVYMCACASVRACKHACVCVCNSVCVSRFVYVFIMKRL